MSQSSVSVLIDLDVQVICNRYWSYAYAGTRRSLVRSIAVTATTQQAGAVAAVYPRVRCETPMPETLIEPWSADKPLQVHADGARFGEAVEWSDIDLEVNYPLLGRLEEKAPINVVVDIIDAATGAVLATATRKVELLGRQDWFWDSSQHDMLAAFVNPRSVAVRSIVGSARDLLMERTGESSTEGYQAGPGRVQEIAKAIYDAVSERGIDYSNPPAGFESNMQRIRTPDEVVTDKAGTCLDTAVLLASCFAEAGLEPVLFLVPGHAFAGYLAGRALQFPEGIVPETQAAAWLARKAPQHALSGLDNADWLAQVLAGRHVQPIETTTVCRGGSQDFNRSITDQNAWEHGDVGAVEAMLIVSRCWQAGITPPIRLAAVSEGTVGQAEAPSAFEERVFETRPGTGDVTLPDAASGAKSFEVDESGTPPRVRQWMAGLLDLSARNPLLRVKKGSLSFDVAEGAADALDDLLFTPQKRVVISSPGGLPSTWQDNGVNPDEFLEWSKSSDFDTLVYPSYRTVNRFTVAVENQVKFWRENDPEAAEVTDVALYQQARQVVEAGYDAELKKGLTALQRKAKDALLSTGTNCLYLAIGSMSWTDESDGRGGGKARQWKAPLYLYPVILEGGRKAPYTLRLDPSGEATPNHCLREKFRREPFNLELPELVDPAEDENGLAVNEMLASIRERLVDARLDNVALMPDVHLGVFDYSTFRLWSDFHAGWETMVEKSDAARHLILTPNQQFPEPETTSSPELEAYLPIDADDSQATAIRWALDGRSFRLEGPPGTGKTQTITNLLASCLAHGKKILFVAEKQAALDQVKKRLSSIGLADYCLDLHAQGDSDTRIRKNIEGALNTALAASADPRDPEWQDVAYRLERETGVLDHYRAALHDMGAAELSAWAAHENLLAMDGVEPTPLPPGFVADHDTLWPSVCELAFDLSEHAQQAGDRSKNVWSFVTVGGPEELADEDVSAALQRLAAAHREATGLSALPETITATEDPRALVVAADLAAAADRFGPVNELVASGAALTSGWNRATEELLERAETLRSQLDDNPLGVPVLTSDNFEHLEQLRAEVEAAGFLNRRKRIRAFRSGVETPAAVADNDLLEAFDTIVSLRPELNEVQTASGTTLQLPASVVDELLSGSAGDVADLIEQVKTNSEAIATISDAQAVVEAFSQAAANEFILSTAVELANAWKGLLEQLPIDHDRFAAHRNGRPMGDYVPAWVEKLTASASATGRFIDLQRWRRLLHTGAQLSDLGFDGPPSDAIAGTYDHDAFLRSVQVAVFTQAFRDRLEAGDLDRFDRKTHDARVRAFEAALADARSLLHERIPGLINKRSKRKALPSGRAVGEAQDLLRNLKPKRGEKTPIRDLIAKFGNALSDAMPCFMMSPDSVASLVPVDAIDFDLVIFDEASQVRTSHAVGALGRGKAGIVVGDSKQMPPTAAFSANSGTFIEDDEDGEDEATTVLAEAARDAESILSEFEESGFPALQLLCHYRSRDELLIAFSNTHVYDEPMLTFPSTSGLESSALRLRVVDDGHFNREDKTPHVFADSNEVVPALRTNLAEAQAVVNECLGRLREPARVTRRLQNPNSSAESIIVVTFNRPQMDLITAMFRNDDPDLFEQVTSEWVNEETGIKHEPQLKIRNLENVQGDEAETVVFSVAFSATKNGRFPLNFGPVTQQGGIRRLNVAVTRAQQEMIVFASFRPDEMGDLSNKAEGARMLQKFLELAQKGAQSTGQLGVAVERSRHLVDVAEAIRARGFEAEVQLGFSQMRVDIAVRRPDAAAWEVAILADGPAWAERGTAYQREVLPMRVLEGLGWQKVIRIWLPAWLEERDAILTEIENAFTHSDTTADTAADNPRSVDASVIEPLGTRRTSPGSFDVNDLHQSTADEYSSDAALITDPESDVSASKQGHETHVDYPTFEEFPMGLFGDRTVLDAAGGDRRARELVLTVMDSVTAHEGPVELDRLVKLVCRSFGLDRVRQSRRDEIVSIIPSNRIEADSARRDCHFVCAAGATLSSYTGFRADHDGKRGPDEISTVEYENAVVWILEQTGSLEFEDLVRELGAVFGFDKMTRQRREVFESAVGFAVSAGRAIKRDDDRLCLP
jgi:hypothetical protein